MSRSSVSASDALRMAGLMVLGLGVAWAFQSLGLGFVWVISAAVIAGASTGLAWVSQSATQSRMLVPVRKH